MRIRSAHAALFACLLALACLPLAACGSGPTVTPGFAELVIGPPGGHANAQNVDLTIPPGAFPIEHVVAILPQLDPPPIGDPGVSYYGKVMCIGPLGLGLDVLGHVRCCYDPALLPKGALEQDLLLLEWDDALQMMFVKPGAVQDLINHCFDDFAYQFLGHIAIGIRTGPAYDFVFLGQQNQEDAVGPLGNVRSGQIFLADLDTGLPTTVLDGTANAWDYLPSRNGSRVMFSLFDPNNQIDSLWTVDTSPPAGPQANRQIVPDNGYIADDATFGWLGDQDRVYHERTSLGLMATAVDVSPTHALAAADGDGSLIADLENRNSSTYVFDVRVSPDKTMALVRWYEYSKGTFEHVDVLNATTGAPIATDLSVPMDLYDPTDTPRWLPDSSGLYYRESDGVTVSRVDPDGSNVATLYTLTAKLRALKDFVVATPFPPDPLRGAMICHDTSLQGTANLIAPLGGDDFYATDLLAGGDYDEMDLGGQFRVDEMVPLNGDGIQQALVLVQLEPLILGGVQPLGGASLPVPPTNQTLVFSSASASLSSVIPTPLSNVDVARNGGFQGQILAWVPFVAASAQSPLDYQVAGIYLLDAQAQNPTLVTPAGFDVLGPPRWTRSWRFAPGFESSPRVR